MILVDVAEVGFFLVAAVLMMTRGWDWRYCWAAATIACGGCVFLAVLNATAGDALEVARFAGLAVVCGLTSVGVVLRALM